MADNTIPQLNSVDPQKLSTSDLLPLFSRYGGADRKLSLGQLLSWIESNYENPQTVLETQYYTPVTGSSITVGATSNNLWVVLSPVSSLATLTIVLPPSSIALDGQEVRITTTQPITTLTLDPNGAISVVGSVSITNTSILLKFNNATLKWYVVE